MKDNIWKWIAGGLAGVLLSLIGSMIGKETTVNKLDALSLEIQKLTTEVARQNVILQTVASSAEEGRTERKTLDRRLTFIEAKVKQ